MAGPPRVRLASLPTPLRPAPRLSEELGVEVWLKRDDLTGLGLGGNKTRPLEYLLGAAEADRADTFVTGGGAQSNWVLLAALAAVTRGLAAHCVLYGHPTLAAGNLALLTSLPEVTITYTGDPDRGSVDAALEAVLDTLVAGGRRPYAVGRGGANAIGALGYADAADEMDAQFAELSLEPRSLWVAVGSGGTLAGLVAGQRRSGRGPRLRGVAVSRTADESRDRVGRISDAASDLLGLGPGEVDWEITDDQRGVYGEPTVAGDVAARLAARTEGIFLDPVFGAKAMAGLTGRAREGGLDGPVVFVVSGGAPTLFVGDRS